MGYAPVKIGNKFRIKIKDILPTSHIKITLICDQCGKEINRAYIYYKESHAKWGEDLCLSCIKKGEKNSQFGKDRTELLKYARTFEKQNPMQGKHHSKKAKEKMSEIKSIQISNGEFDIKSNSRGIKSYYFSTKMREKFYADSLLERLRMKQLDEDKSVISWTKKHRIKIDYNYNDNLKKYIPDFFIIKNNGDKIIEEVKGYPKEIDFIKKEAGEQYCKKNGYKYNFITVKEINKINNYRKFIKNFKEETL